MANCSNCQGLPPAGPSQGRYDLRFDRETSTPAQFQAAEEWVELSGGEVLERYPTLPALVAVMRDELRPLAEQLPGVARLDFDGPA